MSMPIHSSHMMGGQEKRHMEDEYPPDPHGNKYGRMMEAAAAAADDMNSHHLGVGGGGGGQVIVVYIFYFPHAATSQ